MVNIELIKEFIELNFDILFVVNLLLMGVIEDEFMSIDPLFLTFFGST